MEPAITSRSDRDEALPTRAGTGQLLRAAVFAGASNGGLIATGAMAVAIIAGRSGETLQERQLFALCLGDFWE